MIVLVDNYDSFSYNLYQMIGTMYPHIKVIRNDQLTATQVMEANPLAIVLSPGPGRPAEAGICEELTLVSGEIPTLGVCLGHQAICEAAGAKVGHARRLMHGKQSKARVLADCPLFEGLPDSIPVARYHSLSVDASTLPEDLQVTAVASDDEEVMAVQGVNRPLFGLQFHPESILTPDGKRMLENFLALAKKLRE